jgi:hypothetical protein
VTEALMRLFVKNPKCIDIPEKKCPRKSETELRKKLARKRKVS